MTRTQCLVGAGAYITLLYYTLVVVPYPWFYQLPALLIGGGAVFFYTRCYLLMKRLSSDSL